MPGFTPYFRKSMENSDNGMKAKLDKVELMIFFKQHLGCNSNFPLGVGGRLYNLFQYLIHNGAGISIFY